MTVPFIKFNWHGAKIASIVKATEEESARAGAQKLLDRANMHVPYREGILKATGKVSSERGTGGSRAAVSYDTVYAARLHQHPEYNFNPPGEGRWLQNAADEIGDEAAVAMAKPYQRRLR